MSFPIPIDSVILTPSALGIESSSSFDLLNGMCTTRDGSSILHFLNTPPTKIPVVITVIKRFVCVLGL